MQGAGGLGAVILLLALGIWRLATGPSKTAEGLGAGECAALARGDGTDAEQAHSQGSGRGKILGPSCRRQCVIHVCALVGVETRAFRVLGQPTRRNGINLAGRQMRKG